MPTEGQIADGPNGPLVYRGGRWYPMQQTQQPPVDPGFQYAAPKAAADVQKTQTEIRNEVVDARVNEATLPAQIREANAKAQQAELEVARLQAEIDQGGLSSAQRTDRTDRISRLNQLVRQINRVQELYVAGPGATEGIAGIADFFPSNANDKFDVAGAQLSQQGLAAFRVPGTGTVSDRDAVMFDRGNLPTASTRDAKNEEILTGLKARVEEEMSALGLPNPQWGAATAQPQDDQQVIPGSALDVLRTNGGGNGGGTIAPLQDAGAGGFKTVDNPALRRAHDDLVQTLLSEGGGRLDPQRYAQERLRLSQEFGVQITNPLQDAQAGAAWASSVNQYLDAGGRTVPTNLNVQEAITARDTLGNNLVNNPVAGAIIGAANTGGLGIPEALNPGAMTALRDAQGGFVTAGEIGGAIGGTAAIGAGGRAVAGRVAPQLLQGGGRGQFARNVAADATYGGIYGGVTEGEPLTGAVLGTAGSVVGQGAARGLGAAVGGAQRTAAAQALRARGVPVSVARQIGAGRAEDILSSLPFANEAVRNRQLDSFRGFNEAAFQEGANPIGATIPPLAGREGVDALDDAVSNAYGAALGGRSFPLDQQFGTDLAAAAPSRFQLPDDVGARADRLIENHIDPLEQSGQLTGEMFQRAQRGLGKARRNANTIAGEFDEPYRETMTGVLDAYQGLVQRGGGQDVIEGLASANAANKNLRILEDASLDRAKIGTQTGDVNVFTPAQLLAAARKSENRYGGSQGLRELGEQGQEVLPSTVPNSGTADRLIALGVLGGAGGIGGAANFDANVGAQSAVEGGQNWTQNTLAAGAVLGALGTRRGQQVLEQILLTRPQIAQRAGQGIRNRRGLFGSTGSAIALNQQ